jgi:hypothetical protein
MNGAEIILDADADTSITADTDDQIDIKIAGTDQLALKDGVIEPTTDDDIDLGSSSKQFKDLYLDGTATIDALLIGAGATCTTILDEDAMGSDSATSLCTQQSIKAYADSRVGTSGTLVIRKIKIIIEDATNANEIKLTGVNAYNSANIAAEDNIAKSDSSASYALSADGQTITIETAGLGGGNVLAVLSATLVYNNTTTNLLVFSTMVGNDITINAIPHQSGTYSDFTALVDQSTGKMEILILYLTDA